MTEAELKAEVQAIFPVIFAETLTNEESTLTIDLLIKRAIRKTLDKFEKIEPMNIVGTTHLPDAVSILKCVPDDSGRSIVNAFTLSGLTERDYFKIGFQFGPDRIIRLTPEGSSAYIEYLVDTKSKDVEFLNEDYTQWAVEYAAALLKIKEGGIGKLAKITDLPFEFTYEEMYSEGREEKTELEDKLDDGMYLGVISIRSN